ncbi:hypothetical protein A9Q84_01270 [Halobacteriovorax marinus]|uniref:AMP-dependent synthetase/ligase domain-containing protein n=1 Tax=Halobacteriovorax marinus TaxID=97084 RepID=A0A1Y5FC28_9BACT|nr:hypothetical protein A9Q84_01270 [Halobacteriovorax marinus]
MNILVWKGHHSKEIFELTKRALSSDNVLLILCPPRIDDISDYYEYLPSGQVEFFGEFFGKESFYNDSKTTFKETVSIGLFSSGSADIFPKLILYTKGNLKSSNDGIMSFFSETDFKKIVCYPQPYHIFGLSLGYALAIDRGVELLFDVGVYSKKSHKLWLETIENCGAETLTLGTPTHMKDLLSYLDSENLTPCASLTSIFGGESVSVNLWERARDILKIQAPSIGYGCSEASPGVTHLPPGVHPGENGNLGAPLPNVKLTCEKDGLRVAGENICHAIIQNNGIIFPGGEYLMSDIIKKKDDGNLQYISRNNLVLNRGGEKFSLEMIEAYLLDELSLNVVSVCVNDERLGEDLGGLIESPDQESIQNILFKLKEKFNRNFNSHNFKIVNSLPKNSNAKVDRKSALEIVKG